MSRGLGNGCEISREVGECGFRKQVLFWYRCFSTLESYLRDLFIMLSHLEQLMKSSSEGVRENAGGEFLEENSVSLRENKIPEKGARDPNQSTKVSFMCSSWPWFNDCSCPGVGVLRWLFLIGQIATCCRIVVYAIEVWALDLKSIICHGVPESSGQSESMNVQTRSSKSRLTFSAHPKSANIFMIAYAISLCHEFNRPLACEPCSFGIYIQDPNI